jgi:hypothetical protein
MADVKQLEEKLAVLEKINMLMVHINDLRVMVAVHNELLLNLKAKIDMIGNKLFKGAES